MYRRTRFKNGERIFYRRRTGSFLPDEPEEPSKRNLDGLIGACDDTNTEESDKEREGGTGDE